MFKIISLKRKYVLFVIPIFCPGNVLSMLMQKKLAEPILGINKEIESLFICKSSA